MLERYGEIKNQNIELVYCGNEDIDYGSDYFSENNSGQDDG